MLTKLYNDTFVYNGISYIFQIRDISTTFFKCEVYEQKNYKKDEKQEEVIFIAANLYPSSFDYFAYFVTKYEIEAGTMVFEIEKFFGIPPEKQKETTKKLGSFVLCRFVNILLSLHNIKDDINVVLEAMPYKQLINYYQTHLNFKLVNPNTVDTLIEKCSLVPLKQKFSSLKNRCLEIHKDSYLSANNNSTMPRPKRKCVNNLIQYNKK